MFVISHLLLKDVRFADKKLCHTLGSNDFDILFGFITISVSQNGSNGDILPPSTADKLGLFLPFEQRWRCALCIYLLSGCFGLRKIQFRLGQAPQGSLLGRLEFSFEGRHGAEPKFQTCGSGLFELPNPSMGYQNSWLWLNPITSPVEPSAWGRGGAKKG